MEIGHHAWKNLETAQSVAVGLPSTIRTAFEHCFQEQGALHVYRRAELKVAPVRCRVMLGGHEVSLISARFVSSHPGSKVGLVLIACHAPLSKDRAYDARHSSCHILCT